MLPPTSGATSIQGDEESGTDVPFIFLITPFQVRYAGVCNKRKNPKWFLELLCVSLCASRKPDLNVPENTCTPYALTSFVLAQCVINHFKIPSSQCLLPWRGVYCAELHQFRRIRLNIDTLCSHQVGVLEQTTIKIFMLPC